MDESVQKHLTPALDDTSKLLLRAADLIEERGWCQDALQRGDRLCILGALDVAVGNPGHDMVLSARTMSAAHRFAKFTGRPASWFNDDNGRTKPSCSRLIWASARTRPSDYQCHRTGSSEPMKKDHMTVVCDAKGCGWTLDEHVDIAKKWHNAACPACGHKPILSDGDMALLLGMLALRSLGLAHIGGRKKVKESHMNVKFDTAGLRGKDGK